MYDQQSHRSYTTSVASGIDTYVPRAQLMETSHKFTHTATTNVSFGIESQQIRVVKRVRTYHSS